MDIITFVKTTDSTDQFSQNDYSDYLIEQMVCYSLNEWKDMVIETNNLHDSPMLRKYFNFEKLLQDEWNFPKGYDHYIVRFISKNELRIIEDVSEISMSEIMWIVTIPTH
jgi:hypothetical protein